MRTGRKAALWAAGAALGASALTLAGWLILIGSLRYSGEGTLAISQPAGAALAAIANGVVFFWVIWLIARSANRTAEGRLRIERELRAAHSELAALHANAPVVFLVVDEDLRIRKVNEMAARFAGRAEAAMIGIRPGDAVGCLIAQREPGGCGVSPDCGECAMRRAVLDSVEHGNRHENVEVWLPLDRADESEKRCLLISTAPLRVHDARWAIVCALDITGRKRAEEELRKAHDELERRVQERTADLLRSNEAVRESEEKYRLLSEISTDIILTHDLDGRITYMNQTGLTVAGISGTQALAMNVADVFASDGLSGAEAAARWRGKQGASEYEAEFITRSGRRIAVDVHSAPILKQDRLVRVLVSARDISARKQAEAELARYRYNLEYLVGQRTTQLEAANTELARAARELEVRNREVERANRMKTEFVARMSHELRTPLNAIVGYSELLGEEPGGPLPPMYKRFTGNIQEGARHLLSIINDVLDLSRIEAGRIDLTRELFYSADALGEVLAVIAPLAQSKNIEIENQIPPGMRVNADRTRFKQILYNLLSNAVKFTPGNGRIWIAECSREDTACICVGDTGVGIPAEELGAVFDEFHQVSALPGAPKEGSGLGLAITKRLANLHGGTVWVESSPGRGSRFFVSLGPHSLEPPVAASARI